MTTPQAPPGKASRKRRPPRTPASARMRRPRRDPAHPAEPQAVGRSPRLSSAAPSVWDQASPWRALAEASQWGLHVGMDGRTLYANPTLVRMLGYADAQELTARGAPDFVAPEEKARLEELWNAKRRGAPGPEPRDFQALRRNGERFWVEVGVAMAEWNGRPVFVSTWKDASEWRASESALRRSEERFRTLVQGSIEGILVIRDGLIFFANPAAAQIYGFDGPEDMIGQDPLLHIVPEDRERVAGYREARIRGEPAPTRYEYQAFKRGGERIWVSNLATRVEWDGRPAILVTQHDITERNASEAALRRSEERFRNLAEGSVQGNLVLAEGKTIFANRSAARMYGFDRPEDMIGHDPLSLVAPEDRERIEGYRAARLRGEPAPLSYEYQTLKRNGGRAWVAVHVSPVNWDGRPAILFTGADVTERKRAELALRQSEERFRTLVQGSVQAILVADDRIIFANPSAARMYGFDRPEDMVGQDPPDLIAAEDRARLAAYRAARLRGEPVPSSYEIQGLRRDGTRIWLSILVTPVEWEGRRAMLVAQTDITESKRAELALRRSEERFRNLVQGSIQGILVFADNKIIFANPSAARMYGFDRPEDMAGVDSLTYVAPEDRERLAGYRVARARGEPAPISYEYRALKRTGERLWVSVLVSRVEWDGRQAILTTRTDVTESKRAELALRQSEERFRGLVQGSIQGILVYVEGQIIFANPSAARMYGFDRPEEMLGADGLTFVAPEERERIATYRSARVKGEPAPTSYEFQALKRTGERFWLSVLASPIDWDGRKAILVTRTDITESKRAELALRQSEERFRTLIQSTMQGILVVRDGRIVFANPAAARLGGFERPTDLAGLDMLTFVPPAQLERMTRLRQALRSGELATMQFETEGLRRDGSPVWLAAQINPMRWDGQSANLLTLEDISERKRSEAALRQSEEHFRNLVEGSIQGIIIHRGLRLLFANAALARTFGYGSVEEVARLDSVQAMVAPHERARLKGYNEARMRGEPTPDAYEFEGLTRDGKPIWIDCRARVVNWEGERATQLVLVDVTERKRAEQQREALLADLRRANDELRDVAHIVAHDLKAPLRGIGTLVEWLGEDAAGSLGPQGREHLDELRLRTHRMAAMLEGILAYSRAGHEPGMPEPLDSGQVLAEVLDTLAPPAGISVAVAPGMPVVVADRTRLTQVFQNLVGNAIQHLGRPAGHVRVSWRDAGEVWQFEVEDDGVGIDPKHQERVFRMFQRLKPDGPGSGAGLGLSLVKKMVEQEGGTISLRSAPGVGSAFGFTIPKPDRRGRGRPAASGGAPRQGAGAASGPAAAAADPTARTGA